MTDQPSQPTPAPVPTVNPAAQVAVDVIETVADQGERVAEDAIIAAEPWMGTPVLKQAWEAIFDWIVKLIIRPAASLGGRVVIDVEEYVALKRVASAQVALDQAKKEGNANAIQKASDDVDHAVAPVMQYVGATHS